MTVTPPHAFYWLSNHLGPNRALSPFQLNFLVDEIESLRWKVTHQGLAFDWDANLRDGQHRLSAVLVADKPIKVRVTVGLSLQSTLAIDVQRSRSLRDFYGIQGVRMSHSFAAAINRARHGAVQYRGRLGAEASFDFYQEHEEAFVWLHSQLPSDIKGVTLASVLAAIIRAYYHVDRQRLAAFCRVLKTSETNGPGDMGAILLDRWLRGKPKGTRDPVEVYLKAENAIAAFVAQRPIRNLRARGELFPLPQA
jgi:hypothetical protein